MEKGNFINSIKTLKLIAHRLGYKMTNYPENTIDSLNAIFNNKELLDSCDGFEFDICFTKDHIPIVLHDKYVDDMTDHEGMVKDYTYDDIKDFDFSSRKSLKDIKTDTYKIITLEEILEFFKVNKDKLKKKVIKIETKDSAFLDMKNLYVLAKILNKYPSLSLNIVHLSYYPWNLIALRRIQNNKGYNKTKTDLLCENSLMVTSSKLIGTLDSISMRIKTNNLGEESPTNSRRVNKKIHSDRFFMQFSNAISEKIISYAISRFGFASFYVLNTDEEIDEFCQKISDKFFEDNKDKFVFTTDNPFNLRQTTTKSKK